MRFCSCFIEVFSYERPIAKNIIQETYTDFYHRGLIGAEVAAGWNILPASHMPSCSSETQLLAPMLHTTQTACSDTFTCPHAPHMFGCPVCPDNPICLYAPYVWTPPYFWMPLYIWMAPYIWKPPYVWTLPYILTPLLYLDAPLCPNIPTHLYPPCSPVHLYVSRGICIWYGDGGHLYAPYWVLGFYTRIIYKKHYKFFTSIFWHIVWTWGASKHMGMSKLWVASKHMGTSKHMGASNHMGSIQIYGGVQTYGAYGHPLGLTSPFLPLICALNTLICSNP